MSNSAEAQWAPGGRATESPWKGELLRVLGIQKNLHTKHEVLLGALKWENKSSSAVQLSCGNMDTNPREMSSFSKLLLLRRNERKKKIKRLNCPFQKTPTMNNFPLHFISLHKMMAPNRRYLLNIPKHITYLMMLSESTKPSKLRFCSFSHRQRILWRSATDTVQFDKSRC